MSLEHYLDIKIVNGLQGDPVIYMGFKQWGDAFLWDLGSINSLSHKEILKVRQVFISHTHMDHFIGFDQLLRMNVPHKRCLQMFGPYPLAEQVQAKLKGYTWNLLEEGRLRYEVFEIMPDGQVLGSVLQNHEDFALNRKISERTRQKLHIFPDGSAVSSVLLDHNGLASAAYKFQRPDAFKVNPEAFVALGLKPGSWVSTLQGLVRQGLTDGFIDIEGQPYKVKDLMSIGLSQQSADAMVYCTDLSFSRNNVDALRLAFGKADLLVSESSFLEADRDRALAKAHLTSRQAALLARLLQVNRLMPFHVSGIYGQGPETVESEALAYFEIYASLDQTSFESALQQEFGP